MGVGKHMCVVRVQYPQCHTNTYNVPTVPHQHLQRSYRTHQHIQCPQCHTNTNNVLTVPHQHVQCSHRTHQHIQCSQCHTSTYNVQCSQCHTSTYNVHSATPTRTIFIPHPPLRLPFASRKFCSSSGSVWTGPGRTGPTCLTRGGSAYGSCA